MPAFQLFDDLLLLQLAKTYGAILLLPVILPSIVSQWNFADLIPRHALYVLLVGQGHKDIFEGV